jgi:hypothetical protein
MNKIIEFFSPVIALLGLLYGWVKDRELRRICQRANAPFFKFETFELDSSSRSVPYNDQPWYNYRETPSSLNGDLIAMEEYDPSIPDNYPDDLVIGIELQNKGIQIRFFSIKSKENLLFLYKRGNIYSLRYFFKRREMGKELLFTIAFETIDGIQEKQKWLYIKGEKIIFRVKPKSITRIG